MGLLTDKNVIINGSEAKEMIVREWWRESRSGLSMWPTTEQYGIQFIPQANAEDPVLVNMIDHHISDSQGFFDMPPVGQSNPMYKHFRINEVYSFSVPDRKSLLLENDRSVGSWDSLGTIPENTVPLSCQEIRLYIYNEYMLDPIFPSFTTTISDKFTRHAYNIVRIYDQMGDKGILNISDQIASNILLKAMTNVRIMLPNTYMKIQDLSILEGFRVENVSGRDLYIKLSIMGSPYTDKYSGGYFEGLAQDPLMWCKNHEDEGRMYLDWINILEICDIYYQKRILVYRPWDKDRTAARSELREEYSCNTPISDANLLSTRRMYADYATCRQGSS